MNATITAITAVHVSKEPFQHEFPCPRDDYGYWQCGMCLTPFGHALALGHRCTSCNAQVVMLRVIPEKPMPKPGPVTLIDGGYDAGYRDGIRDALHLSEKKP